MTNQQVNYPFYQAEPRPADQNTLSEYERMVQRINADKLESMERVNVANSAPIFTTDDSQQLQTLRETKASILHMIQMTSGSLHADPYLRRLQAINQQLATYERKLEAFNNYHNPQATR